MTDAIPDGDGTSSFVSALDDLKQLLFDAEDAFGSLLEKVEAQIVLQEGTELLRDPHGSISIGWCDSLAFEKHGKSWRLIHVHWDDAMSSEEQIEKTPIVDASLKVRLLAVEKLPELMEAIRQARQQRIERVEKVVRDGRSFLEQLYREEATRG